MRDGRSHERNRRDDPPREHDRHERASHDDGSRDGSRDDATLSDTFWSAARSLRTHSRDALAPWDITPAHSRALVVLARHGAMRLGELSEHLRIAPRSATEVIDALEQRDLVARGPDPADRRATLVDLTDTGHALIKQLRARRGAGSEAYFNALSAAERDQLRALLRKLIRASGD